MEPSVLVAGETLVDFIPDAAGPLAGVDAFDRRAGGAPANVAVRLAQLDETPWFWTRVGPDPFGDFLAETLADHGVPGRFVERDPGAKTTLAFVSHGADGDPSFTFYRDGTADTRLAPGTVPDETLAAVEWVSVGGVPLASEPSRSAVHDLVERASDHDCGVCFDPNARPELWENADFETQIRRVLPECDVVCATPGDLTAAGFEADGPRTLAHEICAVGPHTVFLTLGSEGALGIGTERSPWGAATGRHGGFEVDAVDTTGAGDAFTAGVLAALAGGGESLADVLAFGNAVAAASTRSVGGMAPLGAVESLLDEG